MVALFILVSILIAGLFLNYTSFLRVLMLLEVLLLVTSFFLVSLFNGSEASSAGGLISALFVLALAGAEAAIGLSLILYLIYT